MKERDCIREAVLAELERLGEKAPSQADLHRATGVAKAALSNWLAGKKTITTETASKILGELGLRMRRGG